jgi:hypothetical protein
MTPPANISRIKLHTCFAGPVKRGLTAMIVVGKTPSAITSHSASTPEMTEMLLGIG